MADTLAFWFLIQCCSNAQDGSWSGCLVGKRPPWRGDASLSLPATQVLNPLEVSITLSRSRIHFYTFISTMRRCLAIFSSDSGLTLLKFPHDILDLIKNVRWAKKGVTEESSWKFCFEMQKEILVQVKLVCKGLHSQCHQYANAHCPMLNVYTIMWRPCATWASWPSRLCCRAKATLSHHWLPLRYHHQDHYIQKITYMYSTPFPNKSVI